MYRRSENSESTAGGHTEFTRQSGKLPGEGIIPNNKQNPIVNDGVVVHDSKFDTLDIPACVRGGEATAVRSAGASQPPASGKNISASSEKFCNGTTKDVLNKGRKKQAGCSLPLRGRAEAAQAYKSPRVNVRDLYRTADKGFMPRSNSQAWTANSSSKNKADPKKKREVKRKAAFGDTRAIGNTAVFRNVSERGDVAFGMSKKGKIQSRYRAAEVNNGPAIPLYRKKKKRAPALVVAAELLRKRSVVMGLALCLLLGIIIPIAAFAAAGENMNKNSPDIQVNEETTPLENVVIAEAVSAEIYSVNSAIQKNEFSSLVIDSEERETLDNDDKAEIPEGDVETKSGLLEEINVYTVTFMFADREPLTCMSEPATLREILAGSGYILSDGDKVYVDVDAVIDSDQTVYIDKVEYGSATETESIPYDVETVEVQTIPRGATQVITDGAPGTKEVVYNVEYINGVEVSRTESYSYITEYPQNQVEYRGVGGTVYGDDGTEYSFSYCVPVRATYYNLPGNTASGAPVQDGVVAVDPSVFPLGSRIYMKNDYMDMGVRLCADTGVYGNTVDVWMNENSPYYAAFASQGVFSFTAYVLD